MPRKGKQVRFAQNTKRPNIIEPGKELYDRIRGHWRSQFFGNDHPIVLEVGCGRGEYTVGLAQRHPEKNFIGMDIKGDRIWFGSGRAIDEKLTNVGFLRAYIEQIESFFATGEVAEMWITFPDPQPTKGRAKKRLTGKRFLDLYKKILTPGGVVHLKTDSESLHQFTLEVLNSRDDVELLETIQDIYAQNHPATEIKTRFEEKYLNAGVPIKYLRFRFTEPLTKRSIFTIITSLFHKKI